MLKENLSVAPAAIKDKEERVVRQLDRTRQTAAQRFPLLFTLLASFGLVATFYGFEGLIDKVGVLSNNPAILLAVGILTLGLTGKLYKKLD